MTINSCLTLKISILTTGQINTNLTEGGLEIILKAVSMSTRYTMLYLYTNFQTGFLGTRYIPVWYACGKIRYEIVQTKAVAAEYPF